MPDKKAKGSLKKYDPLAGAMQKFCDASKAVSAGSKDRGMMTPSSSNLLEVWGSDFTTYSLRRASIDVIIEMCMYTNTSASLHPEGIMINYVKAYCWWAFLSFLRDKGCLVDSNGVGIPESVMPKFPETFHLPRPLRKVMEYWHPYTNKTGATARCVLQLPNAGALPGFSANAGLNRTDATKIDQSYCSQLWPQYAKSTSTQWEMTFASPATGMTWAALFNGNASEISDWFSTCNGVTYATLNKVNNAPDASLHAIALNTVVATNNIKSVICCYPKFSAEMAVILGGINLTLDISNLPQLFTQDFPSCIGPRFPGTALGDQIQLTQGFVMVCNAAKKFRRGKAEWLFAQTPYVGLNSFRVTTRKMDLSRWHQITANILAHCLGAERFEMDNQDIVNILVFLQLIWEGALISRVMSYGGWMNISGNAPAINLCQVVLPTSGYDNLELPALIADYISQIGPVIITGGGSANLCIPVLDWGSTPGVTYQYNLYTLLVSGAAATPNYLAYINTATLDNATSFTRPFQFSAVPVGTVSSPCFFGSYMNTGRKKNFTVPLIAGTSTTLQPFYPIDLLEMLMDSIKDQGAAAGANGTASVFTFLNKKRFSAPAFNLPRPVGGSCCMLAEVMYVPGETIPWSTDPAVMDTSSTGIAFASMPGVPNPVVWYSLQQMLKVEAVGSCGMWDQHQTGRIVAFGMFSSNQTRLDMLPNVVMVRGSEAIISLIAATTSNEFKERYEAEKNRDQPDAYAVRGAMAQHYTSVVPKRAFSSLPPTKFIVAVANNMVMFRTAPYYFVDGKPMAESGSWDWLESLIRFVEPVAEVVAAPFGMGGVVKAVGGGLLSLLGTDKPAGQQQSPVAATAAKAVKVVHKHARNAHRHYKGKPQKKPKQKKPAPKGPMVRTQGKK